VINLITVVYQKEIPYLEIQARSIAQYFHPFTISTITVVINDSKDVHGLIDPSWYGNLQGKLKVLHISELTDLPLTHNWDSQQLCKLLAAKQTNTKWSMILDAKTWFIRPVNTAEFITNNQQKVYTNTVPFSSYFSTEKAFVQDWFNVDFNDRMLGPGGVPFFVHTKTLQNMIEYLEKYTGGRFDQFFNVHVANPHRITEFILYAGYVLYEHKSYDAIYNIQDKLQYQVYNVADWQANHFNEILAQCQENSTALTFSVHRRAYQLLSEEQKIRCLEFLYNRKLINSVENTKIRLNTI
jgi:hypothetical protein